MASEMTKMRTIRVIAEVEIPETPDSLRYSEGTISIADITDDGLKSIGAEWTESLLKKARKIRELRINKNKS